MVETEKLNGSGFVTGFVPSAARVVNLCRRCGAGGRGADGWILVPRTIKSHDFDLENVGCLVLPMKKKQRISIIY